MARIAEDLLLLLLDNAAAQPAIERGTLQRLMAAAVLLDLAYECRIRPALPQEPVDSDRLVALAGPPLRIRWCARPCHCCCRRR